MRMVWFIAKRFLFAKKRTRLINVILWVCIMGTAVGVTSIGVALSVLNGFRNYTFNLFLIIDSPIRIIPTKTMFVEIDSSKINNLNREHKFLTVQPFIESKVLLSNSRRSQIAILKSFTEEHIRGIKKNIMFSVADTSLLAPKSIILGRDLQYKLDAALNEDLSIISPKLLTESIRAIQSPLFASFDLLPKSLTLKNLFFSHPLYDGAYALASLENVRESLSVPQNQYSGLDIRFKQGYDRQVLIILEEWIKLNNLETHVSIQTIDQKHKTLFQVLRIEKLFTFIALSLIVVIASAGLVGALTMIAIEKRLELYILRCVAFKQHHIKYLFLTQGAVVGLIGTFIGIIATLLVCYIQKHYELIKMPYNDAFMISVYPIDMQVSDFLGTALFSIIVTCVASIYPSYFAQKISIRK